MPAKSALGVLAILAASIGPSGAFGQQAPNLEPPANRMSYAMGVDMARNFRKQGIDIDADLVMRGMKDGYAGTILLSDKELRRTMNSLQGEVRQKMTMNRRTAADENKTRGATFLEQNKAKEGVVVLASGLQYKILKAGDGRKPVESDQVECNYRGSLLNGTEFDATEPGKPATLKVSALINGWKEALKLMPVGSRWQLVIPANLAYADRGAGSDIGPNETLLFEVELVGIK